MAKKSSKSPTLQSREIEQIGPTESGYEGFGSDGVNPSNPSDAIFQGAILITIPAQEVVQRRSFQEATRSPLHYLEGPGTDETVTSRSPRSAPITGNLHSDFDHAELRPLPGPDTHQYGASPDDAYTKNGALIYGT
jgi:hypothetical protein